MMAGLLGLAGCGSPPPSPSLDITARLSPEDSLFGAIEVRGLSPSALGRVGPGLLLVHALGAGDSTPDLPPLAGRYAVEGDLLRFIPRFRPAGGIRLLVSVKADSLITREFVMPGTRSSSSTTVVSAIYPSADTIPANQLRWYLEFSAPMREGEADANVHLVDDSGEEVEGAFLLLSQELWDPARRRLTLLFDPGRVKRGVRQNLESGAPLRVGRGYALKIDQAWRDGAGMPLIRGAEKRFQVSEAIRSRLDPDQWRIEAPRVGTRDPLTIDFGRALDRALAERLVVVKGGEGLLAGRVTMSSGERIWRLEPDHPWLSRVYSIRVSPRLEDPAGNTVMANFDRDRKLGEWGEDGSRGGATIRFRPLVEGEPPIARKSQVGTSPAEVSSDR